MFFFLPVLLALSFLQSVTALSATRRDLAEFVSVLSSDTSSAVKHAGMNIKNLVQTEDVSHTHTLSLTHTQTHTHTITHAHTHSLTHTLIYTHIHSHNHTHTA